jgi:intracellular multiplication protein IcmC
MLDILPDFANIGSQIYNAFTHNIYSQVVQSSDFSFEKMYENLTTAFSELRYLIYSISYVTGIALAARGVMMYRIFANQTFGSAQRGEMAGPMVHIVVGAVLVYFPSAIDTSLTTLFGSSDILRAESLFAYESIEGVERWNKITLLIVRYLSLIGLIAFFRGWIILSKMAHSGSQPGSIGKGITHIIGGVLLINIVDTVNIIAATLGYG